VQIKNLNERLRAESAGAEKYFNIIINIIWSVYFNRADIIEDIVRQVSPNVKWKILVVDQHALRIINAAVKMNELMDENITCTL
jgi:hypothetical protein